MSTTAIDFKIDNAYKKSESLYKAKTTWQQNIDSLLDRMNDLNRLMTDLHTLLLSITFEIERDMAGFKKSSIAPTAIKKIVANSVKILNRIKHSSLYPGVKTTYHTLHQEISYLNELLEDRTTGIALDTDGEMQEIMKSTVKAASLK